MCRNFTIFPDSARYLRYLRRDAYLGGLGLGGQGGAGGADDGAECGAAADAHEAGQGGEQAREAGLGDAAAGEQQGAQTEAAPRQGGHAAVREARRVARVQHLQAGAARGQPCRQRVRAQPGGAHDGQVPQAGRADGRQHRVLARRQVQRLGQRQLAQQRQRLRTEEVEWLESSIRIEPFYYTDTSNQFNFLSGYGQLKSV